MVVVLALGIFGGNAADKIHFEQNFDAQEVGTIPKEFLVLAGEFAVAVEEGSHVLKLPGAPLDTFGALFGEASREAGYVEGKFFGTRQGRKFPSFGIGMAGVQGYRLQVSPAKGQIEILKGEEVVVSVPYEWKSGAWLNLRLMLVKKEKTWEVEGYAWKDGGEVPGQPLIRLEIGEQPEAGRCSIWGSPYAGTPILFDSIRWVLK